MERSTLPRKILYGLFVFWVGGVAPLVYANVFASSHYVTPYHIIFFNDLPRIDGALPDELATQLVERIKRSLTNQPDIIGLRDPLNHPGFLFQSSLDQTNVDATFAADLQALYLGRLVQQDSSEDHLAFIAPPKTPPRLWNSTSV